MFTTINTNSLIPISSPFHTITQGLNLLIDEKERIGVEEMISAKERDCNEGTRNLARTGGLEL